MNKKIIVLFTLLILIIPNVGSALFADTPEGFTPGNSIFTFEANLYGKLKEFLSPFIKEEFAKVPEEDPDKEKGNVLITQLLAGEKFFVSMESLESPVVSFPVTEDQWNVLIQDASPKDTSYGEMTIYRDNDSYFTRLGKFAVISPTEEGITKAIDLATGSSTYSAANNQAYRNIVDSYLTPRLFGLTINVESFADLLEKEFSNGPAEALGFGEIAGGLLDMFSWEGLSASEKPDGTGYAFTIKVKGNSEKLEEKGFSLNPGGNFTPRLYAKFPEAYPIFYNEVFNPKAEWEQSQKITDDFLGSFTMQELLMQIKAETGLNFEGLFSHFDQEFALALQRDPKAVLPSVTILANAISDREGAKKLATDFVDSLVESLRDQKVPAEAYSVSTTGAFTKLTLDFKKLTKTYHGPSTLPPITLTAGVSEDALFILSTHPDIEKPEVRTGLEFEKDFASFSAIKEKSSGVTYVSVRNIFKWFDALVDWASTVDGGIHSMPINMIQDYYAFADSLYKWKGLTFVSQATKTDAYLRGDIWIDSATHRTYDQFIKDLQRTDSDNDGASDYDEIYLYNTPVDVTDSDDDGISDMEELKEGSNPDGAGRLFEDVGREAFYTDEVSLLKKKKIVSGYPDGTFKPGRHVNRAEFTAMVVKAFGIKPPSLKYREVPFIDVEEEAWYIDSLRTAYMAGVVSGGYDAKKQHYFFRPGDKITRAEAVTILNKASKTLIKSNGAEITYVVCDPSPFTDVQSDAWFCRPVMNAYSNGIAKGAGGEFKPLGFLTRGEAAVMIERALSKDVKLAAEEKSSLGKFVAPVAESAASLIPLGR